MRISDWSSDVCSSDLAGSCRAHAALPEAHGAGRRARHRLSLRWPERRARHRAPERDEQAARHAAVEAQLLLRPRAAGRAAEGLVRQARRSEEHTSELPSLMRNSYAVFCLKKKQVTTEDKSWKDNKKRST